MLLHARVHSHTLYLSVTTFGLCGVFMFFVRGLLYFFKYKLDVYLSILSNILLKEIFDCSFISTVNFNLVSVSCCVLCHTTSQICFFVRQERKLSIKEWLDTKLNKSR